MTVAPAEVLGHLPFALSTCDSTSAGCINLPQNLVGSCIQNLGRNDDEKAEYMLTPLSDGFVAVLLTRPLTVTLIR